MLTTRVPGILFIDIGGVILTNGWDHGSRKRAAEKFGLDYNEIDERHHLTYDTYESGKISLDEYLDRVVFYENRSFTHDDFRKFMMEQSKPFPDMIHLVKEIKLRNPIRIGAISNEGRELTEHRIGKFGLGEFVDFFISSSFVHIRKPDADIYKIALDVAQTRPEDSVYIDDRAMFVNVARSLGIRSIVHTAYESTRANLESHGLTAS